MSSPLAPSQALEALSPTAALAAMQARLGQLQQGQLRASDLSEWARAQTALLNHLPVQFDQVLQDLLNRLEAGALFTEESCSFSQRDIINSLQLWIDKAAARLGKS